MIKIKKQTPIVILFTLILAWAANNLTIRIVAALASTVGETTKSTIFYATILLTIAALSDKRRVISPENIFIVFYIFFYIVGLIYHTSTFPGIISSEATTLIVLGLPAGLLGIKLSKITASKTNNQSN